MSDTKQRRTLWDWFASKRSRGGLGMELRRVVAEASDKIEALHARCDQLAEDIASYQEQNLTLVTAMRQQLKAETEARRALEHRMDVMRSELIILQGARRVLN